MTRHSALHSALQKGDLLRKQGKWQEATRLYEQVLQQAPETPSVILNLALCYFALGRFALASQKALLMPVADSNFWRAYIIHARSQVALGNLPVAIESLKTCLRREPQCGAVALELADIELHRIGDAAEARALLLPFLNHPEHREAALQTYIVASLYDREGSNEALVERIQQFSALLKLPSARRLHKFTPQPTSARKRVGLISAYFSVSPVYFLTYGILKELARHVDLVFYDRGSKKDWAHQRFQAIAAEWVDVDLATPAKLNESLHAGHLDTLLEMAGWSDVDVLRAILDKPCPKIYKWVGGQSVTTGLNVFDGFISDEIQTPLATQPLYSERLINLKAGYVSYTPPEYLPAPIPARSDLLLLGVIGNPVKVSRSFLEKLSQQLLEAASQIEAPIALQFIDSRYAKRLVCDRITKLLKPALGASKRIAVLFTAPGSHQDFLGHVAKLSAVIDTEPYSTGLTALEALALGVPVIGNPLEGGVCSQRHARSHHHYGTAGQKSIEISPQNLQRLHKLAGKPRKPGEFKKSQRMNHQAVAQEMLEIISR